jgi:hypothetical protein
MRAIVKALDPDALMVHSGSLADLEDVKPALYGAEFSAREQEVRAGGYDEETIRSFMDEVRGGWLTARRPTDEESALLLRDARSCTTANTFLRATPPPPRRRAIRSSTP